MSRQPSRIYRGFRMAAVPDADRIHTSSLCWGEMDRSRAKGRGEDEIRTWNLMFININMAFMAVGRQKKIKGSYFTMCVCPTTYQMLVLSLYPTTPWQPRALAWDLISWRISSHQASRVSGSSGKHKILNRTAFTKNSNWLNYLSKPSLNTEV